MKQSRGYHREGMDLPWAILVKRWQIHIDVLGWVRSLADAFNINANNVISNIDDFSSLRTCNDDASNARKPVEDHTPATAYSHV